MESTTTSRSPPARREADTIIIRVTPYEGAKAPDPDNPGGEAPWRASPDPSSPCEEKN